MWGDTKKKKKKKRGTVRGERFQISLRAPSSPFTAVLFSNSVVIDGLFVCPLLTAQLTN